MSDSISIRGKKYPKPHIDNLNRKQVGKLRPLLTKLQKEDLDAVWGVIGVLVPNLPASTLDELQLGECKTILTEAGVANFDNSETKDSDISMGE